MAGEGIHASILENMREGVLCLDMRGEIVTFNPAAEEILGHLGNEVVGLVHFEEDFGEWLADDLAT